MSLHVTNDDKALLLRVAQGDEQAFAELFQAHYNHLGDFILRITESAPLTQEIVQDVFLKIWLNRQALAQVNSFKAYLFIVAKNHTFNCLKQVARERNRHKEYAWYESQLAVNNAEDVSHADAMHLVDQAVELLPPRQKNVFLLSRREGIPHELIAKRLNISHETVKKHMVLALRFLRNHLRTTRFFCFAISFLFPH